LENRKTLNLFAVLALALVVAAVWLRGIQVIDSAFAIALLAAGIGFLLLSVPALSEGMESISFGPFSARMKEKLYDSIVDAALEQLPGVYIEPEPGGPAEGATGGGRDVYREAFMQARSPREMASILINALDSERKTLGYYTVPRDAARPKSADSER